MLQYYLLSIDESLEVFFTQVDMGPREYAILSIFLFIF